MFSDIWYTTDPTVAKHMGVRGFSYLRQKRINGEIVQQQSADVYCMSPRDFTALLAQWNKQGAYQGSEAEHTWSYEPA